MLPQIHFDFLFFILGLTHYWMFSVIYINKLSKSIKKSNKIRCRLVFAVVILYNSTDSLYKENHSSLLL